MSESEKPYSSTIEAIRSFLGLVLGTGGSSGLVLAFVDAEAKRLVIPGLIFAVVLFALLLAALFFVERASQREVTKRRQEVAEIESLSDAYIDCMVTTGNLFIRGNTANTALLKTLAEDLENRAKNKTPGSERMRETYRTSVRHIADEWRQMASGKIVEKPPVQEDA